MYNKLPANKMNKQTDTKKETAKVTDKEDDKRIHRKVCICEKKTTTSYLPMLDIRLRQRANMV